MRDPAVEAAWRAYDRMVDSINTPSRQRERITAVREALAPVRELHKPFRFSVDDTYCDGCDERSPCATAGLIYTTEELE